MIEISKFLEIHEERIRVEILCRVWLMIEAIHYDERNTRENAKITRPAHLWLLDGLYFLTLEELMFLYSLLVHTPKTSAISDKATKTSALLSRLSAINSERFFGTSQYQNFKSVELFISTLSSGGYPKPLLKQRDIPDWLQSCGDTDSST